MKKRDLFLNMIGIFFISLNVAAVIINILSDTPYNLVWFCNHTAIILGLAFLFRSSFWVMAELSIGFIPQLLWTIDFLSKLIFNKFVFGFTDYMFLPDYNQALYILSWNHVFMLPLALVGLYLLKNPVKDAWKGSLLHGILLIPLSYWIGSLVGTSLNCVQKSCIFFIPTSLLYQVLWPPLFFLVVAIPTSLLLYKAFKKQKD